MVGASRCDASGPGSRGLLPGGSVPVPPHIDVAALVRELRGLRAQLPVGPEDLAHFRKIERWGRLCTTLGYATAWMGPNLLSALLISQGRFTRWTTVAHHVTHGGYDRAPGVPARLRSETFAMGWRRYLDWFDCILPEAWSHEHNRLHHSHTGEPGDPDNVEQNLGWLRAAQLPRAAKLGLVAVLAASWKWTYYAPNTLKELRGRPTLMDWRFWSPTTATGRELWTRCYLPYAAFAFGAVPAMFAPLGPLAVGSVFANSVLAEVLTNLHTFAVITPNHAGDDVFRFEEPVSGADAFMLRQILGSANYTCGGDLTDFLQGWLNYQIEHHIWPDLSLLQYRALQPRVAEVCRRHGVPYVQEPVWRRLAKTVDVMVGRRSNRVSFPEPTG